MTNQNGWSTLSKLHKNDISTLYPIILPQVNFGRDFEQQLNFYVDARANFSNLDTVLVMLVQVSGPLVQIFQDILKELKIHI